MTQVPCRATRRKCEEIALEARARLSLAAVDRLEPHLLAEHLGIELRSLEAFREEHPDAVEQLVERNPDAFSGALVPCEDRQVIVFNPALSPDNWRLTICHELAHLLLGHRPTPPIDGNMKRRFNAGDEAEADYLAEALLVPLIAALPEVERRGGDIGSAALHFGVSARVMRARLAQSAPGAPLRGQDPTGDGTFSARRLPATDATEKRRSPSAS